MTFVPRKVSTLGEITETAADDFILVFDESAVGSIKLKRITIDEFFDQIPGDMTIGGNLAVTQTLSFAGISFPVTDGTAGQILETDGNGMLVWSSPATFVIPATNITYDATNSDLAATNVNDALDEVVDYAKVWSTHPVDTLIPTIFGGDGTTDYSAYHWAKKAGVITLDNRGQVTGVVNFDLALKRQLVIDATGNTTVDLSNLVDANGDLREGYIRRTATGIYTFDITIGGAGTVIWSSGSEPTLAADGTRDLIRLIPQSATEVLLEHVAGGY